MKRLIAVLGLAAACAAVPVHAAELPAFQPEAWTIEAQTGLYSLVLNEGEKREYASAGVGLDGPYAGLAFRLRAEVLGEQDGGRLDFSRPQSFRALLLHASVEKAVGSFAFAISGGTTTSIEGGLGAPVDSHLWNAQGSVAVRVKRISLRARAGYDQALDSGYVGGALELALAKDQRPVVLVAYDYPFQLAGGTAQRPHVFTVGARVTVFKTKLSELF